MSALDELAAVLEHVGGPRPRNRILVRILAAPDVFAMLNARCSGDASSAFGVPILEVKALEPGTYVQQFSMPEDPRDPHELKGPSIRLEPESFEPFEPPGPGFSWRLGGGR